jgi:O-antigen/teichoic acid export membrane protein
MRSKNAINNLAAALLLSLITAIAGLILPKLFIMTYGSEVNGLISSIKQFLVYLALVEAGIGYASMAMLYAPLKEKNYKIVNGILSATKIQYIKSGWLFFGLVLVLSIVYPFFVREQIPWVMSLLMVLVLGMTGVAEFFLIGKYSVLLSAAQKGYVVSYIQAAGMILNVSITILMILFKMNPVLVQLVTSVIYLLRFIFLKIYINKNFREVDYNDKPDHQALNKRWDVLIHQIVSLALVNTPIIIITFFLGLKEVSIFTVYLLVHNMIVMLLAVFMNGFQSIFGDIISEKNKEVLAANYHLYECLFFSIVSITYVVAAILYMPFIHLYTRGIMDANYIRPQISIIFVIIGIFHNLRLPPMSILNAAGLFKETKATAIIEAIIALFLSFMLVQFWGIEGVLVGWLTAYIYRIFVLIKQISKDVVYGRISPTMKVIAFNGVFGVIAFLVIKYFIFFDVNSYLDFILNGIICTIVSAVIVLLFNFFVYRQEYKAILSKVSNVFLKKKRKSFN